MKPRSGAYLVAGWLAGIILNLALVGVLWALTVRNPGLAIGAFALARLPSAEGR